ncbi:MAG: hypothetical protein R6U66_13565 [Bacteroidales bacterium]|jgi:MFS family permease
MEEIQTENNSFFAKRSDVETILVTTFQTYKKLFLPLFLYSFVGLLLIQSLLFVTGFSEFFQNLNPREMEDPAMISNFMRQMIWVVLISLVAYSLLNVTLLNYVERYGRNQSLLVTTVLGEAARKYFLHFLFFILLATVMIVLGTMIGIIAIIVGAFVAALYLGTVLIPGGGIIVAEHTNAFETIGRAFQLTHKNFWVAVGSVVLYLLIMLLISLVLSAIIMIPFVIIFFQSVGAGDMSFAEMFQPANYNIGAGMILLNAVTGAITYPITAIFSVVLYHALAYHEQEVKAH